jgi:hypothetical protein
MLPSKGEYFLPLSSAQHYATLLFMMLSPTFDLSFPQFADRAATGKKLCIDLERSTTEAAVRKAPPIRSRKWSPRNLPPATKYQRQVDLKEKKNRI